MLQGTDNWSRPLRRARYPGQADKSKTLFFKMAKRAVAVDGVLSHWMGNVLPNDIHSLIRARAKTKRIRNTIACESWSTNQHHPGSTGHGLPSGQFAASRRVAARFWLAPLLPLSSAIPKPAVLPVSFGTRAEPAEAR